VDKGVGGVEMSISFFTTAVDARSQPRAPADLLLRKDPID